MTGRLALAWRRGPASSVGTPGDTMKRMLAADRECRPARADSPNPWNGADNGGRRSSAVAVIRNLTLTS